MIITEVKTENIRAKLKKPFITARRRADFMEGMLVIVSTNEGVQGYGEAPSTAAVTGETCASVAEAVERYIAPAIKGLPVEEINEISARIQQSLWNNTTAKAAVEMAAYDLWAKLHQRPLYKLLGGGREFLENDITISVNDVKTMAVDCLEAAAQGYKALKLKTGTDPATDGESIIRIWREIEGKLTTENITLRIDANQGWTAGDAIRIIRKWEDTGVPIEIVEQPVPAWDLEGLQKVTAHTNIPIAADESVRSPQDVMRVLTMRAADIINVKLMKTGGIRPALQIAELCEAFGIKCMMGCMLEGRLAASAAAHVAASRKIFQKIDLDGPNLCGEDLFTGGPVFERNTIRMTEDNGIGIKPGAWR